LKGTTLSEFFRQRFIQTMVCGGSFIVVDFPRIGTGGAPAPLTRAEEDASGRSRAYLVDYGADEVINWNYDPSGGLEWAVITHVLPATIQHRRMRKWEREMRWIYYDLARTFRMYRKAGESSPIELMAEGGTGWRRMRRGAHVPR